MGSAAGADMASFLLLGFFIGMSHALEADHIAAIGTLATDGRASTGRLAFLGASWGIGHTTTLFLLSLPIIVFGYAFSARMNAGMEFLIGVMLIGFGLRAFWKLRQKKVHFHIHDHGDGRRHLHAHSHAHATGTHRTDPHKHAHGGFSLRAFSVGLAHGAAGSAGLVALAAAATQNVVTAMVYVLIFGLGSVLGMALLTASASWPLKMAEKSAGRVLSALQFGVGIFALAVGASVMVENGPLVFGLG